MTGRPTAGFIDQGQSGFLKKIVTGEVSSAPTFENGQMPIVGRIFSDPFLDTLLP